MILPWYFPVSPKNGAKDLAAPVAQKARHAQHLAPAHAQADMAVVRFLGEILQAEHLVSKLYAAIEGLVAHIMTHHVAARRSVVTSLT